ncbi:MAG: outer membrane beta-barrel protein [Bacteroidota bacterium]|nr:outer membrane beta-barrel protein [Bacteroidota bacterium]
MKNIQVLLFVLTVFQSASAQKLLVPDNYLGVKAGGGVSVFNIDVNTDYSFYYLENIEAGIVFRTFESRIAALQLEVNYTEKGGLNFYSKSYFDTDTAGMPTNEYFSLKSRGIEFSALTHLAFGKGKSKATINFGPYGYKAFSSEIKAVEQGELSRELYPDNNFDFGLKVGAGYSFYMKKGVVGISLLYGHGLINIYKKDRINNALLNQNQVVMLNILYLMKL